MFLCQSVVIVAGARTPYGRFSGSLASVTATELGAIAIKEAVQRAGIAPADVQEVIMGNVLLLVWAKALLAKRCAKRYPRCHGCHHH